MSASLSEFELIERYFRQIGEPSDHVSIGIGDDCAVVSLPHNHQLCLSIDTMVEGIHFPVGCAGQDVAHRAFSAAVSDLAAMGAKPSHFTLALTLPSPDEAWLSAFAVRLSELASDTGISLVGGDTTRGPLTISLQVHGVLEEGAALKRSGAQTGDIVAVTGTLGDAGGGLQLLDLDSCSAAVAATSGKEVDVLKRRYYQPQARWREGLKLKGLASACIDISDGLVADAGHLAEVSKCQLNLVLESLPISNELRVLFPEKYGQLALSAGDDYELLFTISRSNWLRLKGLHPDLEVTEIGYVVDGDGVNVYDQGEIMKPGKIGYQHFHE